MVDAPERYLETFAKAGACGLTVHVEATRHLHRTLQAIRALKKTVGVALNPATPVSALEEIAGDVDVVLVMSVNPGFSWQTFIPPQRRRRFAAVRALLTASGSRGPRYQVDGGVDAAQHRGAWLPPAPTTFVSGAYGVRGRRIRPAAVRALRAAAEAAVVRPAPGPNRRRERANLAIAVSECATPKPTRWASSTTPTTSSGSKSAARIWLRTLGSTYRQPRGLRACRCRSSRRHCRVPAPCLYDEELVVVTEGRLLSPIRVAFSYAVERADGAVAARGRTEHAALGRDGRPRRLPAFLRDALGVSARSAPPGAPR